MKNIILILALSCSVSGWAQAPANSALERVQRLIYGSNPPPVAVTAPAVKPPQSNTVPVLAPAVKSVNGPASAPKAPDWNQFVGSPPPVVSNPPPIILTKVAPPKSNPPIAKAPRPAAAVEDTRFSPVPEGEENLPAAVPVPSNDRAVAVAAAAPTISAANESDNLLDDKHRLSPGDKISFQILEDRDPAKSLVVTDSGELDIPYVGRVRAVDKTCRQLGRELKTQLEQEYYYRASVVLGLDAASKVRGKIYIWGQVRQQGAIDIPTGENFTVGKAVLRAGGFADFANKKKVKLVRTNPDGTKTSHELNMVDVLEKAQMQADMTVQEDDFIIVPSRLINF